VKIGSLAPAWEEVVFQVQNLRHTRRLKANADVAELTLCSMPLCEAHKYLWEDGEHCSCWHHRSLAGGEHAKAKTLAPPPQRVTEPVVKTRESIPAPAKKRSRKQALADQVKEAAAAPVPEVTS
jgi:hypothetical protein